jgi:hypothetical protein
LAYESVELGVSEEADVEGEVFADEHSSDAADALLLCLGSCLVVVRVIN